MHGQCRITTQEYCNFVRGYYHPEATLCSQVLICVLILKCLFYLSNIGFLLKWCLWNHSFLYSWQSRPILSISNAALYSCWVYLIWLKTNLIILLLKNHSLYYYNYSPNDNYEEVRGIDWLDSPFDNLFFVGNSWISGLKNYYFKHF